MMNRMMYSIVLLGLVGCASVELPAAGLERTSSTLRGAEELGAAGVPDAKLHAKLAADQTAAAKRLASAGDDRAPLVLARAEADADLSLGLAREAAVHADALAAAEELKELRGRLAP